MILFGTGAMALLFGARLSRGGAEVTLAGRWVECLSSVRRRGIEVEDESGRWSSPAHAVDLARSLPRWSEPPDAALVLVKSHQTPRVAPHAARAASAGATVLTLQNGLGNERVLAAAGCPRTVAGVCTAGATLLAPGRVREAGLGRTVLPVGEEAIAGLLRAAGFAVEETDDIESWLWRKLAVNCAINPLTALERVTNGELLARPRLRREMAEAAREVAAVASARGVRLADDPAAEAMAVAERTADNRSSMLQDVLRGARTEIDAICGEVVRAGREAGVPTPVNARLHRAVVALGPSARDEPAQRMAP